MASSQNQIAVLAEQIAEGTKSIDSYLKSNGLPTPSFDVDGPSDLRLTKELQDAKAAIIGATQELQELLLGPQMLLFSHHVSQLHCGMRHLL